jgi:acetyl esterase/lipase
MHTPTLVTHGALDYRVPDCNGLAYYNTLKARGIDARLLWFPDENHWVLKPANSRQWHDELFMWLQRHAAPARPARRRRTADPTAVARPGLRVDRSAFSRAPVGHACRGICADARRD